MSVSRTVLVFVLVTVRPAVLDAREQLESNDFAMVAIQATAQAKLHGGAEHVLVVFDIDNTLLATDNPLGSDQWFMWQAGLLEFAPKSRYAVARDMSGLLRQWAKLMATQRLHVTQPKVPCIIDRLAEEGFRLMILTARGVEQRRLTLDGLRQAGIDVSPASPSPLQELGETFKLSALADVNKEFSASERVRFKLNELRPVSYGSGLLLSAGQNKGVVLRLFLRAFGQPIKGVVFVDDQEKNTNAVFDALRDTDIDVVTVRFSGEDENIHGFLEGDKRPVYRQWRQRRRRPLHD